MARRGRQHRKHRDDGYALVTVLVFSLILITSGTAFFSMAQYETKEARYRQASSEAFYLADGAIERARARFIADRAWRDGWSDEPAGNGTYDLAVSDTTVTGYDNAVHLLATGHVGMADRSVSVIADVPPTGFDLALLIMGDASIGGNLCVTGGEVHVNGDPGSPHITCGGVYTSGFTVTPPPIYTDPAHFPGATYYYVKGNKVGSTWQAKIYDADGVDITGVNNMKDETSYTASAGRFNFTFDKAATVSKYFDETTGIFHKDAGDSYVVVNFGEAPVVNPPGATGISAVTIDKAGTVRTTIVNSRFVGVTEADRLNSNFWVGGLTMVKQVTFEPRGGIAFIAHDFEKQGGSGVQIGTDAFPALVYVTRDVVAMNSNGNITGTVICLRDWHNTGGPNVEYTPAFIPNLPDYLRSGWASGVSGTLKVLSWRELAASD